MLQSSQDYNRLWSSYLLELVDDCLRPISAGPDYILDHPDLVVAANDVDAIRRLFEIRTVWPGTRHARLAIANTLSGEYEEANRHVLKTIEWIDHHRRINCDDKMDEPGPERPDIAAILFFRISQNKRERGRTLA